MDPQVYRKHYVLGTIMHAGHSGQTQVKDWLPGSKWRNVQTQQNSPHKVQGKTNMSAFQTSQW